jgi:anti-anti-sigma factor
MNKTVKAALTPAALPLAADPAPGRLHTAAPPETPSDSSFCPFAVTGRESRMAWSCTTQRLVGPDRERRHRHGDRPPPRAARPPRLSVHPELAGDTAILVVTGELDLTTVPMLGWHLDRLLASSPARLVFDLTGVGFLDVAAARLISQATQSLPGAGRPVIRRPGPGPRRVLELTGFDTLCEILEE